MLDMQQLAAWSAERLESATMQIPFQVGPLDPEWGDQDRLGLVQELPGSGLQREGTFEQITVLLTLRAEQAYQDDLRAAVKVLDDALLVVSNETIWGGYVTFVDRYGTLYPAWDEPGERISYFGNYVIEMGR